MDRVGHHLPRYPGIGPIAISIRPDGDRVGGDLLLVPVERDAVDGIGGSAAPDGAICGEPDVRDASRIGAVQHSLGDHVQQRARVIRLVRIHHVEAVVRESLLERRLDRLAPRTLERSVLKQLPVYVLEHVLPRRRLRGGREQQSYEYRSFRQGCAVLE